MKRREDESAFLRNASDAARKTEPRYPGDTDVLTKIQGLIAVMGDPDYVPGSIIRDQARDDLYAISVMSGFRTTLALEEIAKWCSNNWNKVR